LSWKTMILGGGYFTIFTLLKPPDTLESRKPSNWHSPIIGGLIWKTSSLLMWKDVQPAKWRK
jgi:hypothetical protein